MSGELSNLNREKQFWGLAGLGCCAAAISHEINPQRTMAIVYGAGIGACLVKWYRARRDYKAMLKSL